MSATVDHLTDSLTTATMSIPLAPLLCHRQPGELSIRAAHELMQLHLYCTVDTCRARRAARFVLVESGRMVLDERAER